MAVAEGGWLFWRRVWGRLFCWPWHWWSFERHLVSTSWWWRTSLGERLGLGGQAWLVVAGGISNAVVGPFDRPARGSADREARHRNHKTTRALDECDISPRIEKGRQAPLRHVETWSPKIRHRVTGANWSQNCYVLISSNSCCMFKLNVR